MNTTEERECIEKIKNGDPASFRYIVDNYKHMAFTIALKIVKDKEEAEDVAQESFIKAFQQLHQFEGKSKFSTWLYTIVFRSAISKSKEKRIKSFSLSPFIGETYGGDYKVPQYDEMKIKDEQKFVKEAIQRLPETEGLLITLYYLNDNSVQEIHEITGLARTNIKIRLFRARKKLERDLKFLVDRKLKTVETK